MSYTTQETWHGIINLMLGVWDLDLWGYTKSVMSHRWVVDVHVCAAL